MKLLATQSANVSVVFTNASGFPTQVEGDVTWTSSDMNIATVVPNETDSHKATVTAGPSAGTATITADADADLGAGVTDVNATLSVEVVARGQASGGEIHVDTPDQGLPSHPNTPSNALPGSPNRPDQGLPGNIPPHPDNTTPGGVAKPK